MPGTPSAGALDRAGLTQTLVEFCRALRDRGLLVSPAESIDAARVVSVVDVRDPTDVRLGLRTLLTAKPGDLAVFDAVFDAMWPPPSAATPGVQAIPGPQVVRPRPATAAGPRPLTQGAAATTLERWVQATEAMSEDTTLLRLPSARDARRRPAFVGFDAESMREAVRVARRVARRLAARTSRRWRAAPHGPRLDLRRTVRAAMRTAGDLSLLIYRRRARRRTRLVVLCDVSGSMDLYVRPLLQFLFALQHSFARVETFAFATRLSRITADLRAVEYGEALSRISRHVDDWNGGTRIGESLAAFAADWLRLVDRRTVVIVLSDGWDTGEPSELAAAMATIKRRAGRIIWLNPLVADIGYEPRARGMQAALPYIDVFAGAHDLESLAELAGHLSL